MKAVSLNTKGLDYFIGTDEYTQIEKSVIAAHDMLENKTGAGRNMLGWLDSPERITSEEIEKIKTTAEKIRNQVDVFIVIGIGGSYLGSKAIIDMFADTFHNYKDSGKRNAPQIIFAGNTMSAKYIRNLVEYIDDKEVAINVISKSGKTLEPAITFRILKLFMEEKYGAGGACERIYVTTDKETGLLKEMADKEGYETFIIPKDVGGRYSLLTAVGLLPIAVAGIDFEELIDGALFARQLYNLRRIEDNDCYKYAAIRNILYSKGKDIEVMASYEPSFDYFIEWYKQLFAESEGKDGKGIFPVGMSFTKDLHSMGQMVQDGKRNLFETVLNVKRDRQFIKLPFIEDDADGLNYLAGQEINEINKKAMEGTYKAHLEGDVPTTIINIEDLTEYNIGQLIFFFEKAAAISGYVLGVNPFNQPGVEAYKENMMKLLKENNL